MPSQVPPSPDALAVSIVVNVEEGAEMSVLDGDRRPDAVDEMGLGLGDGLRNFGNESNYRYGLKEGFARICGLLTHNDVPATWTTAALALERSPHIAAFIAGRGDEAASHGERWIPQHRMDEETERAFIREARDRIAAAVGVPPLGHLSRYLHTERTRELLVQEGFRYHMDDYSADEPFWDLTPSGPIVVVPYAIDTNDMKMWHDPGYTARDWLDYLVDTFDELYAERRDGFRLMSVGIHLRIAGRPGRIRTLRRFIAHVQEHPYAYFTTRLSLSSRYAAETPPPGAS
jgi:allantoinase